MDSESARPDFVNCPHCLKENDSAAERCAVCGQSLVLPASGENPYAPPQSHEQPLRPHAFHIGSLMLLIALIAVCLSLLVTLPGLGVIGLLVLTPATIRTVHGAWRDRDQGRPMSWGDWFRLFAASISVVLVIELGTFAAFAVTCFPIGLFSFELYSPTIPWGMFLAFGVGLIAAAVAGFYLIRGLWPRRNLHAAPRPHVPGHDPEPLP